MTPSETVTAFIAAIERMDLDTAVAMLSEDVSYENMPMSPIVGRAAVRATMEQFLGAATSVDWPVSAQFAEGNRVANERVDRFRIGEGWLELPVAGFFEVDGDGLISLWRDYFDLPTYMDQLTSLLGGDATGAVALQPIVYVTDMDRSIAWYGNVVAREPASTSEHWSTFDVGGVTLALHHSDGASSEGSVGLSLVVDDDLEAFLERTGLNAAIQDQPFGRSLTIVDPDGTPIQVNEHH